LIERIQQATGSTSHVENSRPLNIAANQADEIRVAKVALLVSQTSVEAVEMNGCFGRRDLLIGERVRGHETNLEAKSNGERLLS
jgi:hypothetical protein